MTTWTEEISKEMKVRGEWWTDVESAVGVDHFNVSFNDGPGTINGKAFTVWTKNRVYFPTVDQDGAEGCESVSRNPDGFATWHIG